MAERLDRRVQLVISEAQVRAIDQWRRQQPDLPSRSAAIRRLIEIGLTVESSSEGKSRSPQGRSADGD